MSFSIPDVISRYFEASARRDTDAIVVDESQTRHGIAEIRDWRDGVASAYEYTTTITGAECTGEQDYLVTIHLAGNFPGGIVDLRAHFTLDGDLIRRLEMAP